MALNEPYFRTEGPWSDGSIKMLCLDTGSWRTKRPVIDKDICIFCGFCSLFCPPQCMEMRDEYFEPNLAFCKGCGICATECPKNAITMKPEGDFK
jgi:pyruvate ferredoxin oxidoreductase delta subunit